MPGEKIYCNVKCTIHMHICMYVIVFKDNCEQKEKYNKDKLIRRIFIYEKEQFNIIRFIIGESTEESTEIKILASHSGLVCFILGSYQLFSIQQFCLS